MHIAVEEASSSAFKAMLLEMKTQVTHFVCKGDMSEQGLSILLLCHQSNCNAGTPEVKGLNNMPCRLAKEQRPHRGHTSACGVYSTGARCTDDDVTASLRQKMCCTGW